MGRNSQSLVNHNVGTNGYGGRKEGEEELEMGEMTFCMTSSLTTEWKGTLLSPEFSPIKAARGEPVRSGERAPKKGPCDPVGGAPIDRQMAVSCRWLCETSRGVKVSGEV